MIKDTSIPMPEVRRGVETALPVLRAGNGTMVYCKAGINRSPMMACCILIASGHSAEEAMALVKERRPVANPYHPTYRKHILKFEQQWQERKTNHSDGS
jgi:protein-tyrosine phosphatase